MDSTAHNDSWYKNIDEIEKQYNSKNGISKSQAQKRLKLHGPNTIAQSNKVSAATIFINQFKNWLIIILLLASTVSIIFGDKLDAIVIVSLVIISAVLGFIQEYRTEKSLVELKKYITTKVKVKRDQKWQIIDAKKLVPGDYIEMRIGDIVPADIRLSEIEDLTINESTLTGESVPVEKSTYVITAITNNPASLLNMALMGTSISSGYGKGYVVATGKKTFFGKTAKALDAREPKTDFQIQTQKFSHFLFNVIAVMTIFIFIANTLLGKGIYNSFMFALALAIGLVPELLPVIITLTLSKGALKMAKKEVIIKRLMSVEDLGNMDYLCMDKTGTITEGIFALTNYFNLEGTNDPYILELALLTLYKAKGDDLSKTLTNPTDIAIWQSELTKEYKSLLTKKYKFIDENEFDYERKRMSVMVKEGNNYYLISKGSPETLLEICNLSDAQKEKIQEQIVKNEASGFRALGIAIKEITKDEGLTLNKNSEKDMNWVGSLIFMDPIKPGIEKNLNALEELNIKLKLITGDSKAVAVYISKQAGIDFEDNQVITGDALLKLNESEFKEAVFNNVIFARVTPELKYRIVNLINQEGNNVGFMGDGVNDAPALKAADVGISVDTAVPIAKEAADIILLKKDLGVLYEGIIIGRETFGNITKYILNTISANFGNMFTVIVASLFLKFIPLLPSQILLNNLISDLPLFALSSDNVDEEMLTKPRKWSMEMIKRWMIYFGLISAIFDLMLIIPMIALKIPPEIFRTAWFIESSLSEMLITFSIRTRRPFYKSVPSLSLILLTIISAILVVFIPLLPSGQKLFDFTHMPYYLWLWIFFVLISYFVTVEVLKKVFYRFSKYQ